MEALPSNSSLELHQLREKLDSRFPQVDDVFEECIKEAKAVLSPLGIEQYIEQARFLGKMGRGVGPMMIFLQEWPQTANILGEKSLECIKETIHAIWKSPNGTAITAFLESLPAISRRLPSEDLLKEYLAVTVDLMNRTSTSIHGIHKTYASPSLVDFIQHSHQLLGVMSISGIKKWVDYGVRNYHHHPENQRAFFQLKSSDSKAVMQRERSGTLLVDNTRKLDLYLLGLWNETELLVPYPTGINESLIHAPYYDHAGIRLPDVYEDLNEIPGIDRYRATLAHMAGHRTWSTPIFADNFSPLQRLAVEFIEDARIDFLIIKQYPGLEKLLLSLHPKPFEGECNPQSHSCIRHRLAMLSRAIIDINHGYQDAEIQHYSEKIRTLLAKEDLSTQEVLNIALSYVAKTRLQSDQLPQTYFKDTEISYRDDNRHLWKFYELSDDEEQFDLKTTADSVEEIQALPPRHYSEWDYASQTYRPDWVSLYEGLHPAGDPREIDQILEKHSVLAKRLKRLFDLLKPQNQVRIRYQEEGDELDLDVALRSLIDLKSGNQPDLRINMSHKTNGRSIAVMLLLDLSESLNAKIESSNQSILELSQEAVALFASSIDTLGDPFAIAGFHSNSRHDVNYLHIKGYSESWNDDVKGRLANLNAKHSTRMGAAMRHAAHYLNGQSADKKLMIVLTDGEPSDIDVSDENVLIQDARQAVIELDHMGIFTYCINLDKNADQYVGNIFGKQFTVIDRIEKLPEQLPRLFMALTH